MKIQTFTTCMYPTCWEHSQIWTNVANVMFQMCNTYSPFSV